jgi:hypothetical protein
MLTPIVNAAPMVIDQGIQDLSTREFPRVPENIPQHLPKFFVFARQGLTIPELVSGSERDRIFGSETWDLTKKYANHATVFANVANSRRNACMIQRIIPDDAAPPANFLLSLDVLPALIDQYERNVDGSIKYDSFGRPTVLTDANGVAQTIQGYRVKWVTSRTNSLGEAEITTGDQTNPTTGDTSTRYPILEMEVTGQGEYGNLCGIRLWAPTTAMIPSMPTKLMNTDEVYPYFISIIKKKDNLTSPSIVESVMGETRIMTTFKPNVTDPLTGVRMYVGERIIDSYQNLTDLRYPKLYGDFAKMNVYDANVDLVLKQFFDAEMPYFDNNDVSDFRLGPDRQYMDTQKHLINFVSFVQSNNIPYYSLSLVNDATSIILTDSTNVYATGGSDGTMNNEVFNSLVAREMEAYANPNSNVHDIAVNVESIMYDSGFDMPTKRALANFIALRKDTAVVLSTHIDGDDKLDAFTEYSIATRLKTYLDNFKESDYFGTPVTRGMVIARSARLRGSLYSRRLPLTCEVLAMACDYMGSDDGVWRTGKGFDGAPGSVIEGMHDINITWVPASVRNRNWDTGLNYPLSYDRRSFFFPALKTIYTDDTSVLNSFITMMACCYLNKVAHACWREFSGTSKLTNAQLAEAVNDFIRNRVKGKFDNRFVIKPEAYFTDMDVLRGFSWTVPIKIYAPNMKTVMTTSVQVYRIEDLQTGTTQ